MSNFESLAVQWWEDVKNAELRLLTEAGELKEKLRSLLQDPQIKELLEQKDRIKKRIVKLREEDEGYARAICSRRHNLEYRPRVLKNPGMDEEFTARLRERKKRLAHLRAMNAPEVILENEIRMVFELQTPITELEALALQQDVMDQEAQREVQQLIAQGLGCIEDINQGYREIKQGLEQAILDNERKRQDIRLQKIQWGAQDRQHLGWVLNHQPLYKDDVIRLYKENFPDDRLLDLFPVNIQSASAAKNSHRRRKEAKQKSSEGLAQEISVVEPNPWRFWITFTENSIGEELPFERNQFLGALKTALHKAAYHNLDTGLVYDRLRYVVNLPIHQRQSMKQFTEVGLLGWKILYAGKKHRLFLSIDEQNHHLRFLPCPRKEAYLQHNE